MMRVRKWTGLFVCLVTVGVSVWADVKVTGFEVKLRWPWNGLVDITYSIQYGGIDENGNTKDVYVDFTGIDNVLKRKITMTSLTGDGVGAPVKTGGPYKVTWDAAKDYPTLNSSSFQVKIHATDEGPYMVVDLSPGPSAARFPVRYTHIPPDLSKDTCRTTELWLRRIPAGTFMMGSPANEIGREEEEILHEVILTKDYYIGVFEMTQKQCQLIINYTYGGNYYSDDKSIEGSGVKLYQYNQSPAHTCSYYSLRGKDFNWPQNGHKVTDESIMGRLRNKTGLLFDLPTEAQWEYACRAGTSTALNSGMNIISASGKTDDELSKLARYYGNSGSSRWFNSLQNSYTLRSTISVASYHPNAWGLYDMHGNVLEWCLDWYGDYSTDAVEDPKGPEAGTSRVMRGGSFFLYPIRCRSAERMSCSPDSNKTYQSKTGYYYYEHGFRVVCQPAAY